MLREESFPNGSSAAGESKNVVILFPKNQDEVNEYRRTKGEKRKVNEPQPDPVGPDAHVIAN